MRRDEALLDVVRERARQERLHPGMTAASHVPTWGTKTVILGEEFGEVCRAVQDRNLEAVRRELVHVAAVAIAWLESLPAEGGPRV